eukprot:1160966-Pelagomonas_calceolata.AAC.1
MCIDGDTARLFSMTGVRKVVSHALGCPDSPSSALHCYSPSKLPSKSLMETKRQRAVKLWACQPEQ